MLHQFVFIYFSYFFEIQRSFSTEGNCGKVVYTHVLSRGKTHEKHYGKPDFFNCQYWIYVVIITKYSFIESWFVLRL